MSSSEAGINLKMADVNQDYNTCPISDLNMQCMSTSETGSYGEHFLTDQLLTFPVSRQQLGEKKDLEKAEFADAASKNLYESLLLDKCGEDGLLPNSNQDWGYFESFISESKIELLDLCSKNELSVNLFSEEDVDNYMFDDDDDSTLSSDVCSLKIRYESFQDNVREKTNVLQEETQFNFFPSVLVNCTRKENSTAKQAVGEPTLKSEELEFQQDTKEDQNDRSIEQTPGYIPKMSYFIDTSNSAEDSEEFSDESSCTISSFDTLQENGNENLTQKSASCSNHLNYGLRAKRKCRYNDDYFYYVESTDGERNSEKREKPPIATKQEQDLDWCPKKKQKHSRKDPPVVIKYIIVNRFKGDKCMAVKLGRIDSPETTVSLNDYTINKYAKLAPRKDYWQEKQRQREERTPGDALNSHHYAFHSRAPKRKCKLAHRLKIQRIKTVEQLPNAQATVTSDTRQEVSYPDDAASMGMPLTIVTSCANTLNPNDIIATFTRKSRTQEREERSLGSKDVKIKKFQSEASIRSKKIGVIVENNKRMDDLNTMDICEVKSIPQALHSPCLYQSQKADASSDKYAFVPPTCSLNKEASCKNVTSVSVIPGGYLQTLLDPSDSSSNTTISFFPHQTQDSLELSLEKQEFTSIQLAQTCVLSPPSESELQHSPQSCLIPTQMWQPQRCPSQQFVTAEITESAMPLIFNEKPGVLMSVSGYSQQSLNNNRILCEKNYLPEQPLPPDAEIQACQGQPRFHRATLHTNNGRLISYNSVGSLSATSSNYSSLSRASCEKESEEDVNEEFLAHYSPKLVIQQSIDAITPLRESADLLDISNFTPDKFRHTPLSELSPPVTPNLSPQVKPREMKTVERCTDVKDGGKITHNEDLNWSCKMIKQQDLSKYSADGNAYQRNVFNGDHLEANKGNLCSDISAIKGSKVKRRNSLKKNTAQGTTKTKAPKAPKTDKGKVSRTSKKLKRLSEEKANHPMMDGNSEVWSGMGGFEIKTPIHGEPHEFEEPSNILSNIVSGMAEVQRFMMSSVEPLWGPTTNMSLSSEANSLKLKTLKILEGTSPELKKKVTVATGTTKGRKAGAKAGKNQANLNTSLPFFPQLALGCNMFEKPNLGLPGVNGPAHKKMYRHKTSAKFPRIEKGTPSEKDPNTDISLIASLDKLR